MPSTGVTARLARPLSRVAGLCLGAFLFPLPGVPSEPQGWALAWLLRDQQRRSAVTWLELQILRLLSHGVTRDGPAGE